MTWESFYNGDRPNETQNLSRGLAPTTADWQGFNTSREDSWSSANQSLIANNLLPNTEIAGTGIPGAGAAQPPWALQGSGAASWAGNEGTGGSVGGSEGGWNRGSWDNSSKTIGEGHTPTWHHHHHDHGGSQPGAGESSSTEGNAGGQDLLSNKLLSDPSMYQAMQSLQSQMTPQGFAELEQSLNQTLSTNPNLSDSGLMQQAYQQLSTMGASSQDLAALQNLIGTTGDNTGSNGSTATSTATGGDSGTVTTTTTPVTGGDGTGATTTTPTTGGDGTGTTTTTPVTGADGTGTTTTTPVTGADGTGTTTTTPVTGGDGTGTTTTTPVTGGDGTGTTTTTSSSGAPPPDVPAGTDVPTNVIFNDNFSSGSLNTSVWSPTWFGNGNTANNTTMESSNVSEGPNGLNLTLNSNGTGAIVSTNPDDGQPGHTGFQVAPTPGNPVLIQFTANLPETSSGQVANWPALWLDGQNWPQDGEIDVMEGLGGSSEAHLHYGTSSDPQSQALTYPDSSGGTQTFDALWSTTGVTFFQNGQQVGTLNESMTNPMYLIMENSAGSPSSPGSTMSIQDVEVFQNQNNSST